jgi:hypothetical protein
MPWRVKWALRSPREATYCTRVLRTFPDRSWNVRNLSFLRVSWYRTKAAKEDEPGSAGSPSKYDGESRSKEFQKA